MWKQLSTPSFVLTVTTLCASSMPLAWLWHRLLRLSVSAVFNHCYPSGEVPKIFSYNTAFLMLLPWVKTANSFLESIISSPQNSDWFLKCLGQIFQLEISNLLLKCSPICLSFSICPNQNHLSNSNYSPTFSTKFIKYPNQITITSSNHQFQQGSWPVKLNWALCLVSLLLLHVSF